MKTFLVVCLFAVSGCYGYYRYPYSYYAPIYQPRPVVVPGPVYVAPRPYYYNSPPVVPYIAPPPHRGRGYRR